MNKNLILGLLLIPYSPALHSNPLILWEFDSLIPGHNNFIMDYANPLKIWVDVDKENVYLEIDVPGYKKNEIEITTINSTNLKIKGTKKRPSNSDQEKDLSETSSDIIKSFQMVRSLPHPIDLAACKAKLEDGILYIEYKIKEEKTIIPIE